MCSPPSLELAVLTRVALNSWQSACLCLPSTTMPNNAWDSFEYQEMQRLARTPALVWTTQA